MHLVSSLKDFCPRILSFISCVNYDIFLPPPMESVY